MVNRILESDIERPEGLPPHYKVRLGPNVVAYYFNAEGGTGKRLNRLGTPQLNYAWGSNPREESDSDRAASRQRVVTTLGLPSDHHILTTSQGDDNPDTQPLIITEAHITEPWGKNRPDAHATVAKNLYTHSLATIACDCAQIFIAAYIRNTDGEVTDVVKAAIHLPYNTATQGLPLRTIEAMEKLGARREDMHVSIGSSLGVHQGIGITDPFIATNSARDPEFQQHVTRHMRTEDVSPSLYNSTVIAKFAFRDYSINLFRRLGIIEDNIHSLDVDTALSKSCFSVSRGYPGNMVAVLVATPPTSQSAVRLG